MTTTLSYLPTRATLWRRVLVRQFRVPRRRWGRALLGPVLVLTGVGLVSGATPMEVTPLGLFGGILTGIGAGVITTDGRTLRGHGRFEWLATALDADADGVDDRCDLCPTVAAPAPSADGCP